MSLRCVASVFLGRGGVHQAVQRVWCFPDGTVFRERCRGYLLRPVVPCSPRHPLSPHHVLTDLCRTAPKSTWRQRLAGCPPLQPGLVRFDLRARKSFEERPQATRPIAHRLTLAALETSRPCEKNQTTKNLTASAAPAPAKRTRSGYGQVAAGTAAARRRGVLGEGWRRPCPTWTAWIRWRRIGSAPVRCGLIFRTFSSSFFSSHLEER